ncbi:hypothetical protein F5887DRAFT_1129216 [Amanita rubescens]|nr:hypothetical protein F5887DRAFT_1129216 [Amanita rubescens]
MTSEDEDQSSLFGSPGPSRSPSPALVLPGASDCIVQNVGTIALPGSQHFSELPKDPLALSLTYLPPRHAAQVNSRRDVAAVPSPAPSADASTPSTRSRPSSVVPPATGPKKRKRTRKETQPSPAPSIALPDSSTPLPPNFLRNQIALLGTAGLVAGIKPANLSMQPSTSRGSTPTNPIVLDDENKSRRRRTTHDAPKLGKGSDSMTPSSDIDPALLPAPTNKEIVATLIGQKDIFPVLQCLLQLIAGQRAEQIALANARAKSKSEQPTPAPVPTGLQAPPLKRRRLSRVPAGAADWDVPYPFQEGEGPQEYRRTWERERGKQLISQLINLIRIAARKAATRKYHQQEARRKAEVQSQRSQSAPAALKEPGLPQVAEQPIDDALSVSQQPSEASTPVTPVPETPTQLPSIATPSESTPDSSLDQLISWLLAASPADANGMVGAQSDNMGGTGTGTLPEPSSTFVNSNSGDDVNEGLINSWMNVFERFSFPSDGFASALDTSSTQNQQSFTSASTPAPEAPDFNLLEPFDFDFDPHSTHLHSIDSINTTNILHLPQSSSENASQHDAEQFMRDIGLEPIPASQNHSMQSQLVDAMIDPTLLAISQPQPRPLESGGALILSAPSPMPSASPVSSIGDADPSTPVSALWESSAPDIKGKGKEKERERVLEEREDVQGKNQSELELASAPPALTSTPFHALMGVSSLPSNDATGTKPPSLDLSALRSQNLPFALPTPSSCSSQPAQKKLNKQEIIQRAQERKKHLEEELGRIKMQLWETTIEQSVLIELQKGALP